MNIIIKDSKGRIIAGKRSIYYTASGGTTFYTDEERKGMEREYQDGKNMRRGEK